MNLPKRYSTSGGEETFMHVDPVTLLFEDIISDEMASEMFTVTEDLVLQGTVPSPLPAWLTLWFQTAGFPQHQELLMMATVLPSRVFLSLLRREKLFGWGTAVRAVVDGMIREQAPGSK